MWPSASDERDLQLARRELVERARRRAGARSRRVASSSARARSAHGAAPSSSKIVDGAAQLRSRACTRRRARRSRSPWHEQRARLLEAVGRQRVQAQRLLEAVRRRRAARGSAPAARAPTAGPWPRRACAKASSRRAASVGAVEPQQRLDQLGHRRDVGVGDAALGRAAAPSPPGARRRPRRSPSPSSSSASASSAHSPKKPEPEPLGELERLARRARGTPPRGPGAPATHASPAEAGAQRGGLPGLAREPDRLLVAARPRPPSGRSSPRRAPASHSDERQRAERALAARRGRSRAADERAALGAPRAATAARARRRTAAAGRRDSASERSRIVDRLADVARRPPRRCRCRSAPCRARASAKNRVALAGGGRQRVPGRAARRRSIGAGRAAYRQASVGLGEHHDGAAGLAPSAAATRMSCASMHAPGAQRRVAAQVVDLERAARGSVASASASSRSSVGPLGVAREPGRLGGREQPARALGRRPA